MKVVQEEWTKETGSSPTPYPDTLTVYDAGDFIGYSFQKANQSPIWKGYYVVSSKFEEGSLKRILYPAHSHTIPFQCFAKEIYPAKITPFETFVPHWKIQWQKIQLHESSASDFPWLPQEEFLSPEQPPLSPEQPLSSLSSSSQPPQKQSSVTQAQSQRPLQNKNSNGAKPRVLPSSNPTFHGKPRQSTQEKSATSLSQPSPTGHNVPPQRKETHLMPSPLSPPRADHAIPSRQSTSSSLRHSNSKSRLPSQQVQHQSANNPQRPTSAKKPSHAQIAQVPESPF